MKRRWAGIAIGLVAASAALNLYALTSNADGTPWVVAVVGGAVIALAGVIRYYREDW